jgi:hypothetical protein
MANKGNRFQAGTGSVYTCECCGRKTRNTRRQSMDSKTCPQCWDLAGIDNEESDGWLTHDEAEAKRAPLRAEIIALGGTPEENA